MKRSLNSKLFDSTEALLTEYPGFNLGDDTSELQRAICRIVDGYDLGDMCNSEVLKEALGFYGENDLIPLSVVQPKEVPQEVYILAGVRTAKSMIAACRGVVASQTADVSLLKEGEIPRYSICSYSKDNANVVIGHLAGLLSMPGVSDLVVDMTVNSDWIDIIKAQKKLDAQSFYLWHPTGRPMEIRVVAGSRAGGTLVSRWSFGAVFDEAPRMLGSDDAVVNFEDGRKAVKSRILPGAQILAIGSPWMPYGPIYDTWREFFGTEGSGKVVIKARGPDMNPNWWTSERCEKLKKEDPEVYMTDVLAEFVEGRAALFPQKILISCAQTKDWIPHQAGHSYIAAMDPATRNNSWTFVVGCKSQDKKQIVAWREWIGTQLNPLSPRAVMEEIAEILYAYRLDLVITDQWSADAIRDIARNFNVSLIEERWRGTERADAYLSLSTNMADDKIILPNDPLFIKDFALVERRAIPTGVSIHLAQTSDGRHCDYASATARLFARWFQEEKIFPVAGTTQYDHFVQDKWEEHEVNKYLSKKTLDFIEEMPFDTEKDKEILRILMKSVRRTGEQHKFKQEKLYKEEKR